MSTPTLNELAASKYLSLTTFRKDGTAVATPVWLVRDGDTMRVFTDSNSGKAKRIRNNGRVLVAVCDARGTLKSDQVEASATLQDAVETERTKELIQKRYGVLGRILAWNNERKAKKAGSTAPVGITVTLA